MKEYKQIFDGKYDDKGAVQAIEILNDKPLKPGSYRGRKNTSPEKKQVFNGEKHA